jgi:hypothetical protein
MVGAGDAHEEPYRRSADGNRYTVQQGAVARQGVLQRAIGEFAGCAALGNGTLEAEPGQLEFFTTIQNRLLKGLRDDPELSDRVKRLQSIRGVGEILALSWALEVGDVQRFASIAQAISYCGLTSAQHNSAGKEQRGPFSKQRNKNLQTILVEAAKLAPRYNPPLAVGHERELKRGNRNRATLAVARKLVAYLMAVDKSGKPFEMRVSEQEAAA